MDKILAKASSTAGIPPQKIKSYSIYAVILCVFLGIGQTYVTQVIAVFYPALKSLMALQDDVAGEYKQWVTYWVCYGAFSLVDQFAGCFL